MKGSLLVLGLLAFLGPLGSSARKHYEPNWDSLDTRPLPQWYDDAKVGIFLHWGVYSVPSFGNEWFWYNWKTSKSKDIVEFMEKNYPPGFTYADFGPLFRAELFDPNQWAEIFKAAGAKYIVLTSKHHEGFTNWPSKVSWNWNSQDVGPMRDLVGDLAAAVRNRTDIHFGLYHSMLDFFHPFYLEDKANGFKTRKFPEAKALPELYEIVNAYKPEVIWSDGDWESSDTYWNSTGFISWLYNESPVRDIVVTNDRWGSGVRCKHGDYYTCEDRYNPGVLQKHKWENCINIDRGSWGYRRNAQLADYLTTYDLISQLASTVSCGGNLLMNVGPTSDGIIMPLFEERLRQFGDWMRVNGEAIYSSKPWKFQNDTLTPGVWYTSKKSESATSVYAILLNWPKGESLTLASATPTPQTTVSMLGYSVAFNWKKNPAKGLDIVIPTIHPSQLPCQWAWTLKLENLA